MKKLLLLMAVLAFAITSCSKEETSPTETKTEVQETRESPVNLYCYEPVTRVNLICPTVIDPVCACDVISFQSPCEARSMGFKNFVKGRCTDKQNLNCKIETLAGQFRQADVQCAAVYQPVCGCDGKTYSNYCAAVTSGVLAWTPGPCGSIQSNIHVGP